MSAARASVTTVLLCIALQSSSAAPTHPTLVWTLSLNGSSRASLVRLDRELAAARVSGTPVMIDFFAQWCGACRVLDRGALADPAVVRELSQFITIRIDVSSQDELAKSISERFGAQVLPTIQLISHTGTSTQIAGTRTARELVLLLQRLR